MSGSGTAHFMAARRVAHVLLRTIKEAYHLRERIVSKR